MVRDMKTLKEFLKLDMEAIEALARNPFRLTRIDDIVSMQNSKYIKEAKKRFSKVSWPQHSKKPRSPRKPRRKYNQDKTTINKNNATPASPPSTELQLESKSATKTDIPELPKIFKAIISSLKGFDVTFVMQRKLTKTDLEPNNSRLAMPEKQINNECKFLAHKDAEMMKILEARDEKRRLIGMKVGLVEPSGEVCHNQVLKKWNMTSASTYNLASSSWCDIARRNRLKKDHLLNIWCFNDESNKFYFLLHHIGFEPFDLNLEP